MTEPSSEQAAVIAYNGSAVVSARPGSGKTFTMTRMIAKASEDLLSYQGVIAISYTRKASAELRGRCVSLGVEPRLSFYGTIDGFCLGIIIKQFFSHVVGSKADLRVLDEDDVLPDGLEALGEDWVDRRCDRWDLIKRAFSLGILPVSALSEAAYCMAVHVPAVRAFLRARYTAVFIDEYQDCRLSQHMLMLELVGLGLRGVAFGDLDQSIFAYNGSSPIYLSELIQNPEFRTFSITENRRCHKSIVDYSLKLLGGDIQPATDSDKRVVLVNMSGDEASIAACIRDRVDAICECYGLEGRNEVALLCTANHMIDRYARLLNVPFKRFSDTRLDKGFGLSRKFFAELIALLYTRCGYSGDLIDTYLPPDSRTRENLCAKEIVEDLMSVSDDRWGREIESFLQLEDMCLGKCDDAAAHDDLDEVLNNLDELRHGYRPASPEEVNLLTYYKAKGLEFDAVFCLDCYEYIMPPYKYEQNTLYDARQQSLNLHYVGLTRARKVCYIPLAKWRHNASDEPKKAQPSQFLSLPGLAELRQEVAWRLLDDISAET